MMGNNFLRLWNDQATEDLLVVVDELLAGSVRVDDRELGDRKNLFLFVGEHGEGLKSNGRLPFLQSNSNAYRVLDVHVEVVFIKDFTDDVFFAGQFHNIDSIITHEFLLVAKLNFVFSVPLNRLCKPFA